MLVLFGQSSGVVPPFDPSLLAPRARSTSPARRSAHYIAHARRAARVGARACSRSWRAGAVKIDDRPDLRAARRRRGAPRPRGAPDHRVDVLLLPLNRRRDFVRTGAAPMIARYTRPELARALVRRPPLRDLARVELAACEAMEAAGHGPGRDRGRGARQGRGQARPGAHPRARGAHAPRRDRVPDPRRGAGRRAGALAAPRA